MGDRIELHVTEIGGCVRRTLLKLQGVEPSDPPGYYSLLGTIVHKVAEGVLKGDSVPIAMEGAREVNMDFYDEYKPQIMEKVEKLLEWLDENPNLEVVSIEETVKEQMFYSPGDPVMLDGKEVWITGTPDLITESEVIDFKSGKTRSKKHCWQVSAYNAMLESNKTGRVVYLGAEFDTKTLKNGKVRKKHERVLSVEKMGEYREEWEKEVGDYIDALISAWGEIPDPQDCSDCFFCPYRTMDGCGQE